MPIKRFCSIYFYGPFIFVFLHLKLIKISLHHGVFTNLNDLFNLFICSKMMQYHILATARKIKLKYLVSRKINLEEMEMEFPIGNLLKLFVFIKFLKSDYQLYQ